LALPFTTVALWRLAWPFVPMQELCPQVIRVVGLRLLIYNSPARSARALFRQDPLGTPKPRRLLPKRPPLATLRVIPLLRRYPPTP